MQNEFFFQMHNRLYHGLGWSRKIGDLLKTENYLNIALLVDEGVARSNPYYEEIRAIICGDGRQVDEIHLRGTAEPDYDYLDELAARIRAIEKLDVVIGIGGGSALDISKALAALRTNPGPGIDYRGFDKLTKQPVDSIIIPTTAGTGSEVTINAPVIDRKEGRKFGINGKYVNATFAVLDGKWTASCPFHVAQSAGMDAMVHTLESFMCNATNPLTRMYNRTAFKLLYENLPALVTNPDDEESLQSLLLGAYLSAAGLFNSGSGIAGAFSGPIGVHYDVPHGIGGGIFIASVVEFNVSKGYHDFAELLDLIEIHPNWSNDQKSERFAVLIRELSDKMQVPKSLAPWDVTLNDLEDLAEHMKARQAAFDQNPVPFSADKDARDLLLRHLD